MSGAWIRFEALLPWPCTTNRLARLLSAASDSRSIEIDEHSALRLVFTFSIDQSHRETDTNQRPPSRQASRERVRE
jgi:hypothetical protein